MKRIASGLFVLAGLLGVAGLASAQVKREVPAEVKKLLAKVEQFDLYSLDPEGNRDEKDEKTMHGWKVLGKTTVKDAKTRKDLITTLEKAAGKGSGAKCFEPRHAIRASGGGKTVDLIICFECSWIYIYEGKKQIAVVTVADKVQPTFDKVLKDAKVPLPKQKGD